MDRVWRSSLLVGSVIAGINQCRSRDGGELQRFQSLCQLQPYPLSLVARKYKVALTEGEKQRLTVEYDKFVFRGTSRRGRLTSGGRRFRRKRSIGHRHSPTRSSQSRSGGDKGISGGYGYGVIQIGCACACLTKGVVPGGSHSQKKEEEKEEKKNKKGRMKGQVYPWAEAGMMIRRMTLEQQMGCGGVSG